MNESQRIRVLLELIGGPQYKAQLDRAAMSTRTLGEATALAGKRSVEAARGTFLYGQAIYTLRRYSFYATTGIVALAAEVVRLGFSYNSTQQQAKAMLSTIMTPRQIAANTRQLFTIAAQTPFQFKDITQAFQIMYSSLHPLGVSAALVRNTILGMANGLAISMKNTPAALNRVSIALQHMANMGRLTGQTVTQLGRDGLPVWNVLTTKFGIARNQLSQISALNISPNSFLVAMTKYLTTAAPYAGAALRSQNQTLTGAFSTFKDFLSMAAGGTTSGAFGGLSNFFFKINKQLATIGLSNKPLTMMELVKALDNALSPRTHAVLVFFQTLSGTVQGFTLALHGATIALDTFLKYTGISTLSRLFGGNNLSPAKYFGMAAGMLLFVALTGRAIGAIYLLTAALRAETAMEAGSIIFGKNGQAGLLGLGRVFKLLFVWLKVAGALFWTGLIVPMRVFIGLWRAEGLAVALRFLKAYVVGLQEITLWEGMTAAGALAWLGILGLIAAAILLIIQYHKQIGSFAQRIDPGHFGYSPNSPQGKAIASQTPVHHSSRWHRLFDPIMHLGVPMFDTGGIVPGALGAPVPIIAHGGEVIKANPNFAPRKQNMFDEDPTYLVPVIVQVDSKAIASAVAKTRADKAARG